ncbi:hypothetical protein SEA_BIG4_186 [Microbacterium phage Big4]|nr:hypothetical protein SEA_BIG4_186 [Microbacterium phage Big4]
MNYTQDSTDQYMRDILVEELTPDAADNALTALSTLTSLYPGVFPSNRTFVRPHHDPTASGPSGVRFVVYGDEGVLRSIYLPGTDLRNVAHAIEAVSLWASVWILDSAA